MQDESNLAENQDQGQLVRKETSLSEKIVLLRGMEIFEGLTVSELAAVAAVTEEETLPPGSEFISEGEPGETMYLIVSGQVEVTKKGADGCSVGLAKMGPGGYVGEMALFDNLVRSATVVTSEDTRLLVLHKAEFTEAVREYPQVALQVCKELSRRLRGLQKKIQDMEVCELPGA